jgi:hypothetical protein
VQWKFSDSTLSCHTSSSMLQLLRVRCYDAERPRTDKPASRKYPTQGLVIGVAWSTKRKTREEKTDTHTHRERRTNAHDLKRTEIDQDFAPGTCKFLIFADLHSYAAAAGLPIGAVGLLYVRDACMYYPLARCVCVAMLLFYNLECAIVFLAR